MDSVLSHEPHNKDEGVIEQFIPSLRRGGIGRYSGTTSRLYLDGELSKLIPLLFEVELPIQDEEPSEQSSPKMKTTA